MTEREKIMELAKECGIKNRDFPKSEVWGYERNIEAFYQAAQADAFEQAAQLVDDMDVEKTEYCMHTYEEGEKFQRDAVLAIRQLGKDEK